MQRVMKFDLIVYSATVVENKTIIWYDITATLSTSNNNNIQPPVHTVSGILSVYLWPVSLCNSRYSLINLCVCVDISHLGILFLIFIPGNGVKDRQIQQNKCVVWIELTRASLQQGTVYYDTGRTYLPMCILEFIWWSSALRLENLVGTMTI